MRKVLVLGLTGIVALTLIIFFVSVLQKHLHQSAIKKVSNTFVENILANRANESYDLFTTETQAGLSKEDWQLQVQDLSSFFSGSSPKFDNLTATKNLQLVNYSIAGSDGNYTFSVVLLLESNGWSVQSFNSNLRS